MTTSARETVSRDPAIDRLMFLWNFITMVLIGTAICAWAAYYSDKLPEITAVLGGGGVLAWAVTAFLLLTQKRQEEFRDWIATTVIGRSVFTVILVIASLGFFGIANFLGSIQVASTAEEGEHSLWIYGQASQPPTNPTRLDPAQPVRSVVWTSWFSPNTFVVKIPGYPKKAVTVAPFHRVAVFVPASLRKPVLLFRPTQVLADIVKGASMKLELTDEHGTQLAQPVAFDGGAILTGGEDDITIPPEFEEKWREQVGKRSDLLDRWSTPIAPAELATLELAEKQTILARILLTNNQLYCAPTKVVISVLRANRPFVQEVVLDASH